MPSNKPSHIHFIIVTKDHELLWALNPSSSSPAASGKTPIPCLDFTGTIAVTTTSSSPGGFAEAGDRRGVVRGLGADEVVDYTRQSAEERVKEDKGREVDLVLDTVGSRSPAACWSSGKERGGNTRGTDLAETGELLEAGKVRPLVDSVWALEQFEQAFGRVDSGKARGQVVIKVSGDAG
ncbi:hypothetical protein NKR19_g3588 [Coniochaeta hoffmannii]|uniref:Uncharacterized protein n=1 Tax=Coniochaeta hoffmannii TaxID=91930 RepID=A0AA38VR99_9PEZI|nr:hypothetical protein NKR19_g3588 [Coniochaeta hoffmannii]